MLQYEYAREALKNGPAAGAEARHQPLQVRHGRLHRQPHLAVHRRGGELLRQGAGRRAVKPDAHELHPFAENENGVFRAGRRSPPATPASGPTENTREAIWDAMARKEVYATTGPRMMVRFFGGWDFTTNDAEQPRARLRGYEKGVPMGGDLRAAPAGPRRRPSWSMRCATRSAPTSTASRSSRAGWTRTASCTRRSTTSPGRTGASPAPDGKLPPVGNTVDVRTPTGPTPSAPRNWPRSGPTRTSTPTQPAFYYARVIEIPTPRWVRLRRLPLRRRDPRGGDRLLTTHRAGARLHLADLVHAAAHSRHR
jgi:hypothetical protein